MCRPWWVKCRQSWTRYRLGRSVSTRASAVSMRSFLGLPRADTLVCSSSDPGERGQPGPDAVRVDGDVERGADLVSCHPVRPPYARLPVAEAQHEVAAARWDHRPQAVDEGDAVVAVEDVEEPAVQHGVEGLPQSRQLPGVPAQEPRRDASVTRFPLGGA